MEAWNMETELLQERYQLVYERIGEIAKEECLEESFREYFQKTAHYILKVIRAMAYAKEDVFDKASMEELRECNRSLYQEVLPENYQNSFWNPEFGVKKLGDGFGRMLSFLAAELICFPAYVFENRIWDLVIRMELFVEIYNAFCFSWAEEKKLPQEEEVRRILYWFVSDYQDVACEQRIGEQLGVVKGTAYSIVKEWDLTDLRYLYRYGEYVTSNEEKIAAFLNQLSEDELKRLADTFTEGYRIGFEVTNKDISKKKTVAIYYSLGFERLVRQAVINFEKIGLETILFRTAAGVLEGRTLGKSGFYGATFNRQMEYDHSEDNALYLDKAYVSRRLEVMRETYEKYKAQAAVYGGPAVIEIFGEAPFSPIMKSQAYRLTKEQQKLQSEYRIAAGDLVNQYIKGEERSFTIIAFPVPAIGEKFEEIFAETVKINTLDYVLYRDMQQILIDALNQAQYVEIKGMNGNETDLRVALHELKDLQKETNFENCVADVNIPVGEVFTSPKLTGTNGLLHVKKVFLNELEYQDLKINFADGMTTDYSCGNFATPEEGKKYIKDHVLYHHESLPMGEFAIGTNTTAYQVAKKYGIEDKLPILIAEKMGPHFALGDTCYSHAEDVCVYNPDGKEIVAKDNEISILRKTERAKAYFNCHTDITIPYDELGELSVMKYDGGKTTLIRNGRFVLNGLEELNRAFDM